MEELVGGAFLSSFFQVALERLASSDFIGYFRRGKLDDRLLNELDITLNSINQVLDEAETKQYQSTRVKKWLDDLKHIVYEADQLLDEIATDAPLKKLKAESQPVTSKVLGFFSAFTNPFESRIKEVLQKLDFLAKQKDMLGLKEGICAGNEGGVSWKTSKTLPSTSLVDESSTYGRNGDKEEVIRFLLSNNDNGNQVSIISIVGLGGMGKTTLAQLVYNDHRMQEQFELQAWVYVSESFDVVELTKAILRSFNFPADDEDLNLLQHQLQLRLKTKKYLLVLDDVWNQNGEFWACLLLPFNHGASGSKFIVTTRDKEVASVMKSTLLLPLKQLEDSDCWRLFVRHAFHGKNVSDYPNLVSVGKIIVEKCRGLPLAVKTLGSLLRMKFSQREWVKILETDMWRENDSNINPVLRLSYHNLPSNLKRCFAYCSIFPKGCDFGKYKLIKLWMAEGLLKCCATNKSEEELGNELFDDLESISFFQQSWPWCRGDVHFAMHDLVNDLAKSVSGEFCLRIESDKVQDIPERTRYIWCSLESEGGDKILLEHIYKIDGLRSLMVKAHYRFGYRFKICNNVQHFLYSRLKYLRMLSFCECDISELADEISNLKLLRYLDLSRTGITSLPDSICMLHNLQTLLLDDCQLTELPSDLCKLINLHHLNLICTSIKKMPKHIGRLIHLQTLTNFVVGEHSGSDIKELAKLNHIQRTLDISGLENVIDPADAMEANLKDKKHVQELCLAYGDRRETDSSIVESDVLEALQPNSILNKLAIEGYCGSVFPNWLGDCHLANVVSIDLSGCKFCSQLPALGQLPCLESLIISNCPGIEIIGPEFYGNNSSSNVPFRSLKILLFCFMFNWKEWLCPEGFPSLQELLLRTCPKLKRGLPQHLPSLKALDISDCQELESSIPNAANITWLCLGGCENTLVNELSSSLERASLRGTRVIESSLMQILFNNASLEYLDVSNFNGANLECPSLDLRCCNSLGQLYITDWHASSLPFALDLFTNLYYLKLCHCPRLESFPGGGLPPSLRCLEIERCPKLIASREEWGLFKLNSLKEFTISDDFENVESFPEESMLPPNINTLELRNCSKLRIINYRGLPNSLSTLSISGCPLLNQLYEKEKGERWHEIRHIPDVYLS